ncbi:MAG: FixH family protein [Bacteroidota bacterium]|nr:FixH family protein [Bacteroidota bacterium]
MKLNWGYSIMLVIIVFMGFITYMVVQMFSTKVDLVREDYYETGIQYENRISKLKSGKKFVDSLLINFDSKTKFLQITVPVQIINPDSSNVYFYWAANKKEDFRKSIAQQFSGIDFSNKPIGNWKIVYESTKNNVSYIIEKEIIIN